MRKALLRVLQTRSFEQVSIRDLAAQAGISYATYFRHHPSKEALLDDLAAEEINRLVALAFPVIAAKNARAASRALFEYVQERRSLWTTLLTGGAAPRLRQEFLRIVREIARQQSPPDLWPSVEVTTLLAVSGTIELLSWWLRQERPISINDVAEIHTRRVMAPNSARHIKQNAAQSKRKRN